MMQPHLRWFQAVHMHTHSVLHNHPHFFSVCYRASAVRPDELEGNGAKLFCFITNLWPQSNQSVLVCLSSIIDVSLQI